MMSSSSSKLICRFLLTGLLSAAGVIMEVFLPSVVSMLVPAYILSLSLEGKMEVKDYGENERVQDHLTEVQRKTVFFLGVGGLIFVPVFKTITHLPPFMGILLVLGVLWTVTEVFYSRLSGEEEKGGMQKRVTNMLSRIDMGTILFFLGILMAMACLMRPSSSSASSGLSLSIVFVASRP